MKKYFVIFILILLLPLTAGCLKEKSDPAVQTEPPGGAQSESEPVSEDTPQKESWQVSKDSITNNLMNVGINQGFVVNYEDSTLLTFINSDNQIYKIDDGGKISEAFKGVKASQLLVTDQYLYLTNSLPQVGIPYGLSKFDPETLGLSPIYTNDRQQIYGVYADDDWFYYCVYNIIVCKTDNPPPGEEPRMYSFLTLYKISASGGEPQEVLNYIYDLHLPYISDGWIYYTTRQPDWAVEQEELKEREEGLYKIKLDGTGKTKLEDTVPLSPLVKEGDWLYYSSGGAYRLKIDGSEKVKISEESTAAINVKDNWVYYTSFEDEISLHKMDRDGNNKQKLSEIKSAQDISIIDDWIYFDAYEDSGWSLYRVKTDGSKEEKIEPIQ